MSYSTQRPDFAKRFSFNPDYGRQVIETDYGNKIERFVVNQRNSITFEPEKVFKMIKFNANLGHQRADVTAVSSFFIPSQAVLIKDMGIDKMF